MNSITNEEGVAQCKILCHSARKSQNPVFVDTATESVLHGVEGVAEHFVIPAKAGIQSNQHLDSCFRRNDEGLSVAMEPKFWDFTENDAVFCIMRHPQLQGAL